jgi:hypothetical protein
VIKEVDKSNRQRFDKLANHPLQSWRWGDFRVKTGVTVSRLASFEGRAMKKVFQITWHKIPKTGLTIGYCPKSLMPDKQEMKEIGGLARDKRAIMVKWEPGVRLTEESEKDVNELARSRMWQAGKSLFTKHSFWLDLTPSEDEILAGMNQKTRYNIRLASKRGVEIVEDKSEAGFEDYWRLTEETTKRQGFYAHTREYHYHMWQEMVESGGGHLLKAVYQGEVLAAWILFELNGVFYYPYGASSSKHREVMASNLMMWEVIRLGKRLGCTRLDMWGSLSENPDTKDPWYGFHRFKQGYGGELVACVGTFDQVIDKRLYTIYQLADLLRWKILRIMSLFRR